jgi:peroxiredoxin family protein/TusA-related sulfurtransferase/rhodanese-related sulfurtransferase
VTVVELLDQVLPPMDPEMARLVQAELESNGVRVWTGDGIDGFEAGDGGVTARLKSGASVEADLVLLSIGVKPESGLAEGAGLELGGRGAIKVNDWMQTSDPDIYAAGDAVEHRDRILGKPMNLPLGGPANRQGRLIADHIFLPEEKRLPYPGHLGTAIVRVFDLGAAATGWSEKRLKQAGGDYGTVTVSDFQHAGYYPGAVDLTLKILWEKEGGRLLGAQAVGPDGADKRIDVLATAITGGLTVDDLVHLELAYAPPFGAARDLANTAGFAATNIRNGLLKPAAEPVDRARTLLDVRPAPMAEARPLRDAVHIPLPEVRGRLHELDPAKPVLTACAKGKMSYFASRILAQRGYDVESLGGGVITHPERAAPAGHGNGNGGSPAGPAEASPPASPAAAPSGPAPDPVELDATGIACPGPLMRVQEAAAKLAPGQELRVRASDAGFARDIEAFCKNNRFELVETGKDKGIVHARLRRPAAETASTAAQTERKDTTLIVFSEDMDKALAAFVVANGGRAMGGEVTIFFTFWGLNVLRREDGPKVEGKGFMDKVFGWMMPRGLGALPLSKMHFAGLGTKLMKWRMKSKDLPDLPSLLASARQSGIRLVACSMSMEAMGIRQEELIDGVEIGGVADMLSAAWNSSATLFI